MRASILLMDVSVLDNPVYRDVDVKIFPGVLTVWVMIMTWSYTVNAMIKN